MHIETWDRTVAAASRRRSSAATKGEGAPLSGGTEFTEPDFDAARAATAPLIAVDATSGWPIPTPTTASSMLRRGYNFVDGTNGLGRLDAGLFFIAFVRDPRTHFIPMQTKLGRGDALSEYLQHTGSALFAVPPGHRARRVRRSGPLHLIRVVSRSGGPSNHGR